MFREMIRKHQQLSEEECIKILKEVPRGILCMLGDDDYPYGVPINQYYHDADGHIYFHGFNRGYKLDSIARHDKVCFTCHDEGFIKEGEWALNIKSVVVFGRIKIVEDEEKAKEVVRGLCYKFTDDEEYIEHEFKTSLVATTVLELIPEHITGKLVNES